MNQKQIKRLIAIVTGNPIDAYSDETEAIKNEFLSLARSYLTMVAKEMGLTKEQYDIRTNRAGVAISGDVHLHTDNLYVDFSQSSLGPDFGFMYRNCKGRKDYTGGCNQWMVWERLVDIPYVVEKFKSASSSFSLPQTNVP